MANGTEHSGPVLAKGLLTVFDDYKIRIGSSQKPRFGNHFSERVLEVHHPCSGKQQITGIWTNEHWELRLHDECEFIPASEFGNFRKLINDIYAKGIELAKEDGTPNKAYELDVETYSGLTHIKDENGDLILIEGIGAYNAEWKWCDDTGRPIPQPSVQIATTMLMDEDEKFVIPPPVVRSFRFNAAPQWYDTLLRYTPDYVPYAINPQTGEAHMVLFTEGGW